jgi:hypothetical protein
MLSTERKCHSSFIFHLSLVLLSVSSNVKRHVKRQSCCQVIAWCLPKQGPYRLGRYYMRMTSYTSLRCRTSLFWDSSAFPFIYFTTNNEQDLDYLDPSLACQHPKDSASPYTIHYHIPYTYHTVSYITIFHTLPPATVHLENVKRWNSRRK